MLNRDIVLTELKKHIKGLTRTELRKLLEPQIAECNELKTVITTALTTLESNLLITKTKIPVHGTDRDVFLFKAVMTPLEELEALKSTITCTTGQALMGLAGETSEVLEEVSFRFGSTFPARDRLGVSSFIKQGRILDNFKKASILGNLDISYSIKNEEAYDEELADTFYYLHTLMSKKGINYYARILVDKLKKKHKLQ